MVLVSAGAFAQETGPPAPPPGIERSAASTQYDVPPKLIRSWVTSHVIPKHGPKTPPDDNVVLEILIDTKGRVTPIRVVKSIPFYDDQAIASVRAWLFSPALKNGEPVAVRQLTSIHFGKVIEREQVPLWDEQVAPSPSPGRGPGTSANAPVPMAKEPASAASPSETAPEAETPVPPALAPTLLSAAAGAVPRIELLRLDTQGADFGGWLGHFAAEVSRNWHTPGAADLAAPCDSHFEIGVERNGSVSSARIVKRSGTAAFDRAGLKALFDSSFPPLPARYPLTQATILVGLSCAENVATPEKAP